MTGIIFLYIWRNDLTYTFCLPYSILGNNLYLAWFYTTYLYLHYFKTVFRTSIDSSVILSVHHLSLYEWSYSIKENKIVNSSQCHQGWYYQFLKKNSVITRWSHTLSELHHELQFTFLIFPVAVPNIVAQKLQNPPRKRYFQFFGSLWSKVLYPITIFTAQAEN